MSELEQDPPPARPSQSKSKYNLPSAKLAVQNQFTLLKAFAVASTDARKPVSIQDIADIQGLSPNSVSICNPFFVESGLIHKSGHSFTPCQEVIAYRQRLEWEDLDAGKKLAPVIRNTWFSEALVLRLQMNPITEDNAVQVLSEVSSAHPSERRQLSMLLDYMEFAGIIARDGNMVRLVKEKPVLPPASEERESGVPPAGTALPAAAPPIDETIYVALSIPIPGYPNAEIAIPKKMDSEDWEFFRSTLDSYLNRLQKKAVEKSAEAAEKVTFMNT
ncbi:hypothetical protein E3V39_12440 [Gammaproteobacteria bacterium LSUCC0112]|nr:hypothetical protein E3V39_12440 [Gammaproteobacteria bacterium LSUCC0112]